MTLFNYLIVWFLVCFVSIVVVITLDLSIRSNLLKDFREQNDCNKKCEFRMENAVVFDEDEGDE